MTLRLQKISDWLIWFTPLILFFNVATNKTYILTYALFGLIFFVFKKYNLQETVFLMLVLSLPFERVIRSWLQIVVPDFGDKFNPGYAIYLGIPIKLILSSLLFLILIPKLKKYNQIKSKNSKFTIYLVYFLITAVISTLCAFRQDLALNGIIRLWTSISIFVVCRFFFTQKKIRKHFRKFLICIAIFLGLIGALQFMKHGTLGLYLESISSKDPLGFVTTDGYELFRVSGLMTHPTYFGSFLSLIFPISLGTFLYNLNKSRKVTATKIFSAAATLLTFISILATFSRSAWISLIISTILITSRVKNLIDWKKIIKTRLFTTILFCLIAIMITNSDNVIERVVTLKTVWSEGTGTGRIELMRQAFAMAQNHPLTGVGFNSFTQGLLDQGIDQQYREFFYPVHNTFMLFFAELGVPAGILFFIFETQIIIKTHQRVKKNLLNYSIWVGVLAFFINSQFHTLFSQDPSFDLFMAFAAYLSLI